MKLIDKITGAAKKAVQEKLNVFQFLKLLTPLRIDFSLIIIANVKTLDGNKHDFGIFIKPLEEMGSDFFLRDIQSLIYQALSERKANFKWKLGKAKIDNEEYIAIYLSKLKEG